MSSNGLSSGIKLGGEEWKEEIEKEGEKKERASSSCSSVSSYEDTNSIELEPHPMTHLELITCLGTHTAG